MTGGIGDDVAGLIERAFMISPLPASVVPLAGPSGARYVAVNDAYCELLGHDRATLIGAEVSDFAHSADWSEVVRTGRRFASPSTDVEEFHARYARADGSVFFAHVLARRFELFGTPYVVAYIVDVDRDARASDVLRASEARYRLIVHLAREGIWTIDGEGCTTFVNDPMAEMLGYTPTEMVGRPFTEFIATSQRDAAHGALERRRAGEFERTERQLLRRDGSALWVSISTGPMTDDDGRFTGAIALVSDITEERAARRVLEDSELRLRMLVEHSWDQITVLRPGGQWWSPNPDAGVGLGWDWRRMSRDDASAVLPPDSIGVAARAFQETLAGNRGPDAPVLLRVVTATGEARVLEVVFQNLRHVPGIEGVVINSRDITERVAAQDALREHEREVARLTAAAQQQQLELELQRARRLETVGRFAGGVAHDFNNLLGVILSYAEVIAANVPAESELARDVEKIHDAAERGSLMVRRLLRLGGADHGPGTVFDVVAMLRELLALSAPALREIELCLVAGDEPLLIDAPAEEIERVVLNLLVNARDASPRGATVEVRVATTARIGPVPADGVELVVADHGTGMTGEVRRLATEPFFTTKTDQGGSGLGLTTALATVARLGGTLDIDSDVGMGTTVTVVLPRAEARGAGTETRAETAVDPHDPSAAVGSGRVLVVDDDPDVLDATARLVCAAGFDVATAASAADALTLLAGAPLPAFLITDVRMPGMSGVELARTVRDRWGIPTVLVTGWAGDESEPADPSLPLLVKPFRRDDLLRALRTVAR